MFDSDMLQQAALRIREKNASPEYQKAIERFRGEMIRMEQLAAELEAKLPAIRALAEKETVRTEYASGSDLHRGYYCPSPVFDFVVGNTHRGRLLKRVTKASNPSHEYGFSSDGRLLWCRYRNKNKVYDTEYLIHDGERVLGVQCFADGKLNAVTEEIIRDGLLTSYTQAQILWQNNRNTCHILNTEIYSYDENGLCSSQLHELMQPPGEIPANLRQFFQGAEAFLQQPVYRHDQFLFERSNGMLNGYQCQGRFYQGCAKRSARPVFQINGINLMDIKE